MGEWFSIEVLDARFSARSWAESYGDSLLYAAQLEGATDWNWHYHGWGAVLEIELPDEFTWERFCEAPVVQADLVPLHFAASGMLVSRKLPSWVQPPGARVPNISVRRGMS